MQEFEIAASALETSELRWELQLCAEQFRQSLPDILADAGRRGYRVRSRVDGGHRQ